MKSITLITIYVLSFMFFFFLFSCIGMLWDSYSHVITCGEWFGVYSIFLGWWLAIFPAEEYYSNNKAYFDAMF